MLAPGIVMVLLIGVCGSAAKGTSQTQSRQIVYVDLHDILGIQDHSWQSLYHFTVGGPIKDTRLQTLGAYAHLRS